MNFLEQSLLNTYPLLFYVDLMIFFISLSSCLFVLLEFMFSDDLWEYSVPRLTSIYGILFALGYLGGRYFFY